MLTWVPKKFQAVDEATKAIITVWEDPSSPVGQIGWRWKIRRAGGKELASGEARTGSEAKRAAVRKLGKLDSGLI